MTIADFDPTARVIIAGTSAKALDELMVVDRIATAFVSESPRQFVPSALCAAIAARGGRVVLIGDEAEDTGPAEGWAVLPRPFTTDAVLALLHGPRSGSA